MNSTIIEALNFINKVQGKKFNWVFYKQFAFIDDEKVELSEKAIYLLKEWKFGIETADDDFIHLYTEAVFKYDVTKITDSQVQEVITNQLMCYDSAFVEEKEEGEYISYIITSNIPFSIINRNKFLTEHIFKIKKEL